MATGLVRAERACEKQEQKRRQVRDDRDHDHSSIIVKPRAPQIRKRTSGHAGSARIQHSRQLPFARCHMARAGTDAPPTPNRSSGRGRPYLRFRQASRFRPWATRRTPETVCEPGSVADPEHMVLGVVANCRPIRFTPPLLTASGFTPIRTTRAAVGQSRSDSRPRPPPCRQHSADASTLNDFSDPYCVRLSLHQSGFSRPLRPPKSPGLVQVPTSAPFIHTVMSEGQSFS